LIIAADTAPAQAQHKAQRGHCLIDVAPAGSFGQPIGDWRYSPQSFAPHLW
jgi:hypothetical protein